MWGRRDDTNRLRDRRPESRADFGVGVDVDVGVGIRDGVRRGHFVSTRASLCGTVSVPDRSGKRQAVPGMKNQMLRFAANITFLWSEVPFLDRFAAARRAGFDAVEVLFPYDAPGPVILDRLIGNDLTLALMNAPPPNYTERPRGFAAVPGGEDLFRKDFLRAMRVARMLKPRHVQVMAGVADGPDAQDAMVRNLRWAVKEAPGQSIVIEPMNARDLPGYFLSDFNIAREVIAAVDCTDVRLQFDTYQAHRIAGDAMAAWQGCRDIVGHVQIAGVPDRGPPHGGNLDVGAFLRRIEEDGYVGWVGAEYAPGGKTDDTLGWRPAA